MDLVLTAVGVLLVLVGLNDMFHTLFHPSGWGSPSSHIMRAVWRMSRPFRSRPGGVAGPIGVVLVIVAWILLQVLGWALIYLPHVPEGFSYSPGVDPDRYPDIAEALYVSLVTLATLGFGDVVAVDGWLRLASPVQALIGFTLVTSAVSWFLQLYPALLRRRSLALRLVQLRDAGEALRLTDPGGAAPAQLLRDLAAEIVRVRVDLGHTAETYYFRERDQATCLPVALKIAHEFSRGAMQSGRPEIAAAGALLGVAVDDIAGVLRASFLSLGSADTAAVLDAAATDHGCTRD